MADSVITERVADAAAECFYAELVKTEDLGAFEALVAADMRKIAAGVLRRCIERLDAELVGNMPRGWSVHERAVRTLVTLVGEIAFVRTVFRDEFGRRRALADELLGIPPRARVSPRCFLWIAAHASELSFRKTAAEFEALTSARISHVTVMNVVHREGRLLRESGAELARDGLRISQDAPFVESDGLWVHLQEPTHRKSALPLRAGAQDQVLRAQDGRGLCGQDRGGAGPLQKRRPVPDLRRRRRRHVPGPRAA